MPNTHTLSIGIDEAGRGPLLGGVMVSAVLLPTILSGTFVQLSDDINFKSSPLAGLNDSKKLTAKRREQYAQAIQDTAIGYVLVDVPAVVIDGINVLQASLLAMQLASDTMLKQISAGVYDVYGYGDGGGVGDKSIIKRLQIKPLVDGNRLPSLMMADHHHLWQPLIQTYDWSVSQLCPQAIIKGDMLHSSIAAASILAKVSRDKQMLVLAKRYPQYLIDKHKGYPTQAHLLAIAEHGILPEHRRSFAPICLYRKSH
ncbi:ribonuclease HII [Moraxella lincolnii]|uniref:Ribonuclease n=2 Tax=Lwoffella lincolnii TaxID=90241 RepID=A0A1T0CI11_9GAMM|nr:ribonuclease HII [Moraxella lincolnii]